MEIVHKESLEYQDGNSDVEDEAIVHHPDVLKMFRYKICLNHVLRLSMIM